MILSNIIVRSPLMASSLTVCLVLVPGQPMPEKPDYSIYSSHAAHDPNQVTAQTEPVSEQPADSACNNQRSIRNLVTLEYT